MNIRATRIYSELALLDTYDSVKLVGPKFSQCFQGETELQSVRWAERTVCCL